MSFPVKCASHLYLFISPLFVYRTKKILELHTSPHLETPTKSKAEPHVEPHTEPQIELDLGIHNSLGAPPNALIQSWVSESYWKPLQKGRVANLFDGNLAG